MNLSNRLTRWKVYAEAEEGKRGFFRLIYSLLGRARLDYVIARVLAT